MKNELLLVDPLSLSVWEKDKYISYFFHEMRHSAKSFLNSLCRKWSKEDVTHIISHVNSFQLIQTTYPRTYKLNQIGLADAFSLIGADCFSPSSNFLVKNKSDSASNFALFSRHSIQASHQSKLKVPCLQIKKHIAAMPKTPAFNSKLETFKDITGEEEFLSKTSRANTQKRSCSALDKLYYLKVDEINKPVFFSKPVKPLNSNDNFSESAEIVPSNLLSTSLDSSSLKKAKLLTSENLTDHLGNNTTIETLFEQFDKNEISQEKLFHLVKTELQLIKPLITTNKSLREKVFIKLSKGVRTRIDLLQSVYLNIQADLKGSNCQKNCEVNQSNSSHNLTASFDSKPKIIDHTAGAKLPFICIDSPLQNKGIFTPDVKNSRNFSFVHPNGNSILTNSFKGSSSRVKSEVFAQSLKIPEYKK